MKKKELLERIIGNFKSILCTSLDACVHIDLSSNGAAIVITCVVTLLVSVTVTAIVSSIITYMLMKRKIKATLQGTSNKV